MKITQSDLEKYRRNTLDLASKMGLDQEIFGDLGKIDLRVIPGNSYPKFYGHTNMFFDDKAIEVYEQNPSKHFSKPIQEAWNQSGMDHELIGHLYNFLAEEDGSERGARKTQLEMIKVRAKEDRSWYIAKLILKPLLRFRDKINKKV